jgi:hypothetical protein
VDDAVDVDESVDAAGAAAFFEDFFDWACAAAGPARSAASATANSERTCMSLPPGVAAGPYRRPLARRLSHAR